MIILYHRSDDARHLIEVKRYNRFTDVKRWAKQHGKSVVYAKMEREGDTPLWFEFSPYLSTPNIVVTKLASKDIERLPTAETRE